MYFTFLIFLPSNLVSHIITFNNLLLNVLYFFSGGLAPVLSNHFLLQDSDGKAKMISWQHIGETLADTLYQVSLAGTFLLGLKRSLRTTSTQEDTHTSPQQPLVFPK